MLFNSYPFILLFLPVVLIGFYRADSHRRVWAVLWLALASLFFYGWWTPKDTTLLFGSILFNYCIGLQIRDYRSRGHSRRAHWVLALAVAVDLLILGYFKYATFVIANINGMARANLSLGEIVLPIGISFFTFTQITYLVDVYKGKADEPSFVKYLLFVTYFPHLIAGPILHHKEMMPQFSSGNGKRKRLSENLAVGTSIFIIGLFKKVILADGITPYSDLVFDAARDGMLPNFVEAWCGALAYTLQLYFDFSGYSDMAIGLSRMFGIRLPINFNSPYKAASIIDFWRRWHMTLSRFLRDYLYIPLGGGHRGPLRRYMNLMITMLLGGLWHGAGWTFVIWGGLHGLYLAINHLFRALRGGTEQGERKSGWAPRWSGRILTFLAVVVGWVLFRAADLDAAQRILSGMAGLNGIILPQSYARYLGPAADLANRLGVAFSAQMAMFKGADELAWIGVLLAIAWLAPNTQQIMGRYRPVLAGPSEVEPSRAAAIMWRPDLRWTAALAIMAVISLLSLSRVSVFLYFQF